MTVADAVERLRGRLKAAVAGETTLNTTKKAIEDGHVRGARTLVLWCEAIEPKDLAARWALARRLAGLE